MAATGGIDVDKPDVLFPCKMGVIPSTVVGWLAEP